MSILGQNHSDPVTPAARAATQIKNHTSRLAQMIVREWEQGFDAIWNNPNATPAEVLVELGTDASEVFELNTEFVAFMGAILPNRLDDEWARIQEKLTVIQAHTVNPDGTVTLD